MELASRIKSIKKMRKTPLLVAAVVLMLALISESCKRCVSCTYIDETGAEQVAKSCGKKNNEDLEDDLNTQWGKYGEVVCKEQ